MEPSQSKTAGGQAKTAEKPSKTGGKERLTGDKATRRPFASATCSNRSW
jgi:hypothetical protein